MNRDHILRTNRRVYDELAACRDPLCRPAKDEEIAHPLATVDQAGWLGKSIAGLNLLCLAAGGGRQSSLYAAAGANVTVVDLSRSMLELDRRVAAERGFCLRLIESSMDDLAMLDDQEFDVVIHPVSTCYLPRVAPVFAEVARVTRPGGIYISQHKQPSSLQASVDPAADGRYAIEQTYYRDTPVEPPQPTSSTGHRLRESGAIEFLHRWEELIGGICRAGFMVEDLAEPLHANAEADHGSFTGRARYIAPYVRIKARRRADCDDRKSLWLPK